MRTRPRCLGAMTASVLLAAATPAGAELAPEWTARYSSQPDAIGDEAYDVIADAAGNVYVTGTTGTWGQLSLADIVTIKYAPDGTEQWVAVYDGPLANQDLGSGLLLDGDGNPVVFGRSQGDFIVLKYDATDGSPIWESRHNAGGTEQPNAGVIDEAGNVYLTGLSWTSDQNDIYTIKMSAAGVVQWTARYNGPGAFLFAHDVGKAIALDPDGNVIVTGYSNAPGQASGDFYTIKYDGATGATLWADRYSGGPNESGNDLVVGADGDVYVTGGSYQSGFKYVTIRYRGSDGARLWTAIDSPQFCNVATGIAMGSDGDLFVTGWSDPDCNESNFNENITTIRYRAADGANLWQDIYGSNAVGAFDMPRDIAIDEADNLFVTGENTGLLVLIQYDPVSGAHANLDTIDTGADEIAMGTALAFDPDQNVLVTGFARNYNTENRDYFTLRYPSQAGGLPGDLDGNGRVDVSDLLGMLSAWGACAAPCAPDLDGDGLVNVVDLLALLANWS